METWVNYDVEKESIINLCLSAFSEELQQPLTFERVNLGKRRKMRQIVESNSSSSLK